VERDDLSKQQGLFGYSFGEKLQDLGKWTGNSVVQLVKDTAKLIGQAIMRGPNALPQTPLDLPPDDYPPTSGTAGAVVTPSVMVCGSRFTCALTPSTLVPIYVYASTGSGGEGGDSRDGGTNSTEAAGDTAATNVSKGYVANADGTITGPRGGKYSPTSAFDSSGNPIFIDSTGNYYTLTSSGVTRVVSPNPASSIGVTGQIGENALKSLGGQSQVTLQTSQGARVIDQLAPDGIANEAKVGYTTLDASTALQVSKDDELLQTKAVNGVAWNFYTSPVTGQGGPSAALLKALTDAGIKVIIH
jgi:filamentous hemagglutinin